MLPPDPTGNNPKQSENERGNSSIPSWGKLRWKRKETGSAGTAGARVTAVVATLIVAVADELANGK